MAADLSANATFQIDTDAECGSRFAIGYRGAAYEFGFANGDSSQQIDVASGDACEVVTSCAAQTTDIDLNDGSFFERSRPGNGLVSHVIPVGQPDAPPIFFAAWYTGELNRNNTWYILQEDLVDGQVVSPIIRFTQDVASPTWAVRSRRVSSTSGPARGFPLNATMLACSSPARSLTRIPITACS